VDQPSTNFKNIVAVQRNYFREGTTLPIEFRRDSLKRLLEAVTKNESIILEALKEDLNKHTTEAYISEIAIVKGEIKHLLKNLRRWTRVKRVKTPLIHWPSKSYIYSEPYGVVLIMAPWNYPFQLSLTPLVGAIAAGNCAVVKPSAYAKKTSGVIKEVIATVFPKDYITVVEGGREETSGLLKERFDYIFFTGSPNVGKVVLEHAAKHLTPVTLELGGKSPAIVTMSANIRKAAKRILFSKLLNAGQTCIASDYVLVDERVKDKFIAAFKEEQKKAFPEDDYSDYPKIINERHTKRLEALGAPLDRGITLIEEATFDDKIMEEEIFGPLLPIIAYKELNDVTERLLRMEKPLALYLFSNNRQESEALLQRLSFGGGCLNDALIHMVNPHLPFGGVGNSGMGSYHGKYSFETFSHRKGITKSSTRIDLPFRYRPYSKIVKRLSNLYIHLPNWWL
jgi:aldehyde dehydrogenase (NAD+)